MKRVLVRQILSPSGRPERITLSEAEAHHLIRVYRLPSGASVLAVDGRGRSIQARLRQDGTGAWLEPEGELEIRTDQCVPVQLELSVLKGDAMEWAIEKAVELGVSTLVPILCAHTVVKPGRKAPEAFRERWQKIADQALKQCGRLAKMEVLEPLALEELPLRFPLSGGAHRAWADEKSRDEDTTPSLSAWLGSVSPASLSILIGPEGGWSEAERPLLASCGQRVALGPLVLRAETAALFSSSLAASHFRDRCLTKGA